MSEATRIEIPISYDDAIELMANETEFEVYPKVEFGELVCGAYAPDEFGTSVFLRELESQIFGEESFMELDEWHYEPAAVEGNYVVVRVTGKVRRDDDLLEDEYDLD